MGTFKQEFELAATSAGPFETVEALVDTGATYTTVPATLLESLGVRRIDTETFVLADGSQVERPVGEAVVKLDGRERTSMVVFGDEGAPPLLGAITLEAFSLSADMRNRLTRVPGYMTRLR